MLWPKTNLSNSYDESQFYQIYSLDPYEPHYHFQEDIFGLDRQETSEDLSIAQLSGLSDQSSGLDLSFHYHMENSGLTNLFSTQNHSSRESLETDLYEDSDEEEPAREHLTMNEINTFPEMRWQLAHSVINRGEKCSFCLEQYSIGNSLRVLSCLHRFHRDCLDRWLSLKANCPLCKQSFISSFHSA